MVIGKRELSVVLLVFGAVISVYMALLANPTSAQNGGGGTTGGTTNQDGDCSGAEVVDTFTGSGNQQTAPFEIEGTLFRITSEVNSTADDPNLAFLSIFVNEEDGDFVTSASQDGEGTESSFVNAGPGQFFLDITAANAEFTITVEDCIGSEPTTLQPTTPQQSQNGQSQNEPTIINIPNKPLPPTGGLPVYGMVAGSIIAGAGLLGLGMGIRRGQRR